MSPYWFFRACSVQNAQLFRKANYTQVCENIAKFKHKVVLHFVYVMDGFRRYVHAWVQALAKYIIFFFILKGRILLFYSKFFVLNFVEKFTKVQNFFSDLIGNKPVVSSIN